MKKTLLPSELKALHEKNNPQGYFFDRDTMRFFGDTMGNFGVRDGGKVKTLTDKGVAEVEVWDLYRKRPNPGKCSLTGHCRYFAKSDGREVFTYSG
jgi:hypothetical protein